MYAAWIGNIYIVKMLIDKGIIQVTEDGRLFLSEEKLASSRWSQV